MEHLILIDSRVMVFLEPTNPNDGIPPVLHSVLSGQPFTACVDCGTELLGSQTPYAIEKIVRQDEVIFEYAVCAGCIMTILQEYSLESRERIREYLEDEPSPVAEHQLADQILWCLGQPPEQRSEEPTVQESLDHCHRCGHAQEFDEEHTLTALLVGATLATTMTTVCGSCMEAMEKLLSKQTRDVHEDFIRRNFPGVPEGMELPLSPLGI